MSDSRADVALIDRVAQSLQSLRGRADADRPLLRIDNLDDAARAHYQFDVASGRLHRHGCRAIPADSGLALYGVWRIGPEDRKLACQRCKPAPMEDQPDKRNDAADMLFGLISLIDQFGSVLRERGQEYRKSEDGRALDDRFAGIFERLDKREQDFLTTLLDSMDGLIRTVRDIDDRLSNSNGEDKGNGHDKEAGKTG